MKEELKELLKRKRAYQCALDAISQLRDFESKAIWVCPTLWEQEESKIQNRYIIGEIDRVSSIIYIRYIKEMYPEFYKYKKNTMLWFTGNEERLHALQECITQVNYKIAEIISYAK